MAQKVENEIEARQLAAIRVRGLIGVRKGVQDNLNMLKLYKKNYCCVVPATPAYKGMLAKAKDYITWGEIDGETFKMMVDKRGEAVANNKKIKGYFRLNAPRKGFGRKGIKHPYREGGALGYRGGAINELIKRMI